MLSASRKERNQSKEGHKPQVFALVSSDRVHFWELIWLAETLSTEVPGLNEAEIFRVSRKVTLGQSKGKF